MNVSKFVLAAILVSSSFAIACSDDDEGKTTDSTGTEGRRGARNDDGDGDGDGDGPSTGSSSSGGSSSGGSSSGGSSGGSSSGGSSGGSKCSPTGGGCSFSIECCSNSCNQGKGVCL